MLRLLLTILLTAPMALAAQEKFSDKYTSSAIDISHGLPSNRIRHIYKDSSGFMWISTANGLTRFDGYDFELFDVMSAGLSSNAVNAACTDSFDRLWVASDGGIDVIDLTTGRTATSHLVTHEALMQPASFICTDAKGNIWTTAERNVTAVNISAEGSIQSISTYRHSKQFTALCLVNGKMWAAAGNDIYMLQAFDGKVSVEHSDMPAVRNNCTEVTSLVGKDNEIWAGTDNGLIRINTVTGASKIYRHNANDKSSISHNSITCIAETSEHDIIVATEKGINIYSPFADTFERVENASDAHITSLWTDANTLWIGTAAGGAVVAKRNTISMRTFAHLALRSSLTADAVNTLAEDANGNIWAGIADGGLSIKSPDDTFRHLTTADGLPHNNVNTLSMSNDKTLWVGTDGGLATIDTQSTWRAVAHHIDNLKSLQISVILHDTINNGTWIGTARDICFVKDNRTISPIPDSLLLNMCGTHGGAIDKQGRLWIGTSVGLIVADLNTFDGHHIDYRIINHKLDDPQSRTAANVSCVMQASNGEVIVGSNGYGIFCTTDGNTFVPYNTTHGLDNNNVKALSEDAAGNIWITTSGGLAAFSLSTRQFTNYAVPSRLPKAIICSASSGKMYIGSSIGLTAISRTADTAAPTAQQQPTFTYISTHTANGTARTDISRLSHIDIDHTCRSFSVGFTALSYASPSPVRYQYMLQGFDNQWTDADPRSRTATYTNISAGNYTLQVRCAGANGIWSQPRQLTISIQQPWHKSPYCFLAIAAVGAITLLFIKQRNSKANTMDTAQQAQEIKRLQNIVDENAKEIESKNTAIADLNSKIASLNERIISLLMRIEKISAENATSQQPETDGDIASGERANILVVTANPDTSQQMLSILAPAYNVDTAATPAEAILAAEADIDLIIYDPALSQTTADDFAAQIADNLGTAHMPILTLSDSEQPVASADGIVATPITAETLLGSIANALSAKASPRAIAPDNFDIDTLGAGASPDDERFVRRVTDHIKEHYTNPDYAIDDILKSLGCSKSMLNKKMQSVVGLSPGVIIRCHRLSVAKELIVQNRASRAMNISQIAYEVGFNDPKYFTRCFTRHYGVTPSSVLEADRN